MKSDKLAFKVLETVQTILKNPSAIDAIIQKNLEAQTISDELAAKKIEAEKIVEDAKVIQAEIKAASDKNISDKENLDIAKSEFAKVQESFGAEREAFNKDSITLQKAIRDFDVRNQALEKKEVRSAQNDIEQAERSKKTDQDRKELDEKIENFKKAQAMVA